MANFHEGRLVVLISCISVIPVYFILFFYMFISLDFTPVGQFAIMFMIFINPWIFIATWEILMILFANRIADSYDRMKDIVSYVSIRYNVYYGLTAIFFVFAIVFPLVSPVICSLILGAIVWRLVTARHDWEKSEKTPRLALFIVGIVMIVPLACNLYFYIAFIPQAVYFWTNWYLQWFVPLLYKLAQAMATAVTFGSILYMMRFGTSEYELVFQDKQNRPSEIGYIKTTEIILFVLFLYLVFVMYNLFNYIQYIAIGLNVILILGNLRKGKQIPGMNKSIISYILIIIFFIFSALGNLLFQGIILIISSLIYVVTFVYVFASTPEGTDAM
jgi:hypothetical protein